MARGFSSDLESILKSYKKERSKTNGASQSEAQQTAGINQELELLNLQLNAQVVRIIIDIILYFVTVKSIELINNTSASNGNTSNNTTTATTSSNTSTSNSDSSTSSNSSTSNSQQEEILEIDRTILSVSYINVLLTLISAYIAFTRFDTLVEKKNNGQFDQSLQPNIDINTSVLFGLISGIFFIRAAIGALDRDSTQSIFGI